ncbi:TlpA disulfide reductase family protein [Zobellia sp. B3R18]|uniref:TlpA disulfide reductase family protein n=1 Tax=Zobellia sp. B3R18 TaxID=2841568 RepID=UPI001C0721FD|nr:TlpA disulfide reductase family protein [Zobellia sp. B3R18]MBU2973181.1 AhpC/TSA family protein [Zobellia sp. B3R18]
MKKVVLSVCILLGVIACNQKPEGYNFKGNITGEVENGTKVFLRAMGENGQPVDIDTTTVENGSFVFTGTADSPEMHYVFVDKLMGYTAVILENGDIELSAQKDSLGFAKVKGSKQNEVFMDYMDQSKKITGQAQSIQQDMQKAQQSADEATANSLRDEMMELQEEYKDFELTYIKEHPEALISVLLIDRAIGARAVTAEEAQTLYDGLSPEIKETKAAALITEKLDAQKKAEESQKSTAIGAKAPAFTAPTPDGKELALADALGKVTLIDFWAAWCKPCRAENPNVVNVYKKYHDKGLNIIGVSLDKTEDAWKKAIADDGLTWNQVSNLAYFNDPIAKLYNVDAIPAAFLLDENGVIIAKNLRGPALEQKVAELLQ